MDFMVLTDTIKAYEGYFLITCSPKLS